MPIIEWIPVGWNTPETPNECTTSGTNISATVIICGTDVSGRSEGIGFGHFQDDGQWVSYDAEYDFMVVQKVTHWARMPALPSNVEVTGARHFARPVDCRVVPLDGTER